MDTKTNKFKLSIATRLVLLISLPEQGSVTEMISKRNVRSKIDFSSKEVEEYKLKTIDDKISWSMDAPEVEIEFTDTEIEFLKKIVDDLDKSGKITDGILDFVEMIQKHE